MRILCATLFLAVASTAVDIWWHGTIGRESLFIPPHIALYATVGLAVILGLFGWFRTRDLVWRRIAIILVAIPVAAPFDDLWHRTFGQESVVSPLIVWSPPHVVLALAMAAAFLLLLPAINRDRDVHGRRLFGVLAWGSILNIAIFLLSPIDPLGPYVVLGPLGALFTALVVTGGLAMAARWLGGVGAALVASLPIALLYAVEFGSVQATSDVVIGPMAPPHAHPPLWIVLLAFTGTAAVIDIAGGLRPWIRGVLAGAVYGSAMYWLAQYFFDPEFILSVTTRLTLIGFAVLGGAIGVILGARFRFRS